MNNPLVEEMIQVAAVAVAIAEDLTYGRANTEAPGDPLYGTTQTEQVLASVLAERQRQDAKWGSQHHDAGTWLLILVEEVGEVAEELHPFTPLDKRTEVETILARIATAGMSAKRYLDGQ